MAIVIICLTSCGKTKLKDNPGGSNDNNNNNNIVDKNGEYIIPEDYNPTDEKCFEFKDGIITKYYCYDGNIYDYEAITDLVIPYKIDGMLVYEIGESAFWGKNLTSVVLPNSIKTIRKNAFYDNNLNKITLSETIERIEESAFKGEYNKNKYLMDKWIVPDTLTYINSTGISVKELVVNMEIIPEYAFTSSNIHKLTLGNKVRVIEKSAFGYNSLDELIIPNCVTTIGNFAFIDNFIKELTIPDSVITIGGWSFRQNNITEIHLGKNIETIDKGAFEMGYGIDNSRYANNIDSNTDLKTIYLGNKNQRDFDWENIIDGFHKTSYYKQIKYVLLE